MHRLITPGAAVTSALRCGVLTILIVASAARGESIGAGAYEIVDDVKRFTASTTLAGIRLKIAELEERLSSTTDGPEKQAAELLRLAELMKRAGDYRADEIYLRAIAASGSDAPVYRYLYGNYLRIVRGAANPQFPEAEAEYFTAKRAIRSATTDDHVGQKDINMRMIDRALVSLYERDGLPILSLFDPPDPVTNLPASPPVVFFSSQFTIGRSTNDFPEVDDVRDFTSEALYSESSTRLDRPLTREELRDIARVKPQYESTNRVRFRFENWPVIDLIYKTDRIQNAQITSFFVPGATNTVETDTYGVATQIPIKTHAFDIFLRGEYSRIERKGVIEFSPGMTEDIDHFGIEAAVSRLVGPDKLTVKGLWGYDLINSDSQSSDDRNRTMVGGTVTYQMFRHLIGKSRDALGGSFEMRGVEFFGGLLHDEERFGSTIVEKEDFFGGVTVQQIAIPALSAVAKSFDITVQGTLLRSEISNDSTQENAQFRTNVTLLARLIDEEDMPYVPEQPSTVNAAYLHLAIPFIYDTAVDGPDYFENISIGAEIRGKLYSRSARGASALLVCGYQWTNYFNIDEQLHGYHVSIRLGF